jgi:hypothetical protein
VLLENEVKEVQEVKEVKERQGKRQGTSLLDSLTISLLPKPPELPLLPQNGV